MTGGPEAEACACAVACLLIDWSQHPMWPHCAQRRRWSHHPPASRHSTQPVPLGGTSCSTEFVICAPPATSASTVGERPLAVISDFAANREMVGGRRGLSK